MDRKVRVSLIAKNPSGSCQPTAGEVTVREWNKSERTKRALKFGGACWGLAIFSVILPLLHFFLVPSFLIAGPIVLFLVSSQRAVILGGLGMCPHCSGAMQIVRCAPHFTEDGHPRVEMTDQCEHCQKEVQIIEA